MSDADLTSKLKKELVKSTRKSGMDVHPIPAGDRIFVFTILKEKNNEKIQTFIDSCSNSIVFKDGIEKKLITVTLSDGLIPVSVAGDKEVMATGEWGALIPLADNSYQAMRGLSMERVIGTMPDYKLRLVLAEMKKRARNNNVLQGLHIPTKLGGEVEIPLGI